MQANGLDLTRVDAAAGGQGLWVVVVPAGARQGKQPLSLLETDSRVRIRIEKNVLMVESGLEANMGG